MPGGVLVSPESAGWIGAGIGVVAPVAGHRSLVALVVSW
jgi:hypothetical protein